MAKIGWASRVISMSLFILLTIAIFSVVVVANLGILTLLEMVDFLGIHFKNTASLILFSIGLFLYLIPAFLVGLFIELIWVHLRGANTYGKEVVDALLGFFLMGSYIYFLEKLLEGVFISFYGLLAITFIDSIGLSAIEYLKAP
ncbi:hypothetical protein [Paludifilum halophilum]|uniref:Uncharacterized protein n=1 Tax=Paludifilum halophilum TaxID=1642702 RepID=A0A235B1Q6_9BACL|nr:hypothetical protein [Paludifilum halophilum]OYD06238.1 hypothetical protein CHM34_17410 [Paludifilum halophilum]